MKQTIIFILCVAFLNVHAQKKYFSGTVSSAAGVPLEAASVKIKGENNTVVTDQKGNFEISSNVNQPVLLISHVSYQSREIQTQAGVSYYTIILAPASVTMKEVMVSTGYQQFTTDNATGSFDKIDNKLFERTQSIDVLSRLEGEASGLYFQKTGGNTGMYIRGLSTLRNGASTPLIVLDNFPYEGNINNINPNDVESITLLKDAAASAIWGARAGNGVIVIVTKKGRYGEKNKINFNTNVTIQQKPDLFKDPNFLDASDFIDVEKFLFAKGKYDADLTNTSSRPIISPVVEILAKQRAGLLSAADADAKINLYRNLDVRDDYAKYLYQQGVRQQYALGFSGGAATVNYLINAGYDKAISNAIGNSNDRATLFAVTSVRPLHKMEIQLGVNYTYGKVYNNNIGTILPSGKSGLYPYAQLADSAGNALPVEYTYRLAYLDTAGGGSLLDWKFRPLDEMKFKDNTSVSDDILLKLSIQYAVTPGLNFQVSGQLEKNYSFARNYSSLQTYFARNMINRFSQRSGANIIHNLPVGGILDHSESDLSAYGTRAQADYHHTWNKHELSVIAGAEVRQTHAYSQNGTVYGYDDNTLTSLSVDNITTFTQYGNLGSATIPNNTSFSDVLNRYVSMYSNAVYTYQKKYSLSASARKDASNLFGVSTNNKWTPLWSAGVGWKISDEKFYRVKVLPLLKFRLSYGYNGNVRNDLAAVPTIKYLTVEPITNLLYAGVNSLPNPELRWERVGMVNAGIDFALQNERASGSVEYFHKNATDLLSPTPVDPTIGLSQMTLNTADLSGDGVDIKINTTIIDRKIKVSSLFFFSYVTNKVTRYLITNANKGGYTGSGTTIIPIEGKDPYSIISYKWGGLDPQTGDPQGYINGVISKDYTKLVSPTSFSDLVFTGTTRPPYFGNIIPAVSWKGITLSANVNYKFGYYFRRGSLSYTALFNSWSGNSEFLNRWQKPGDELVTNVPSMTYPSVTNRDKFYNNSEITVEKGDNIRLQDISLQFDAGNIFKKKIFKELQFYGYASNIGILWKSTKVAYDPDYGTSYPPFTFTFGIKANF